MTHTIYSMSSDSSMLNESNDCTVRSIAVTTGKSYDEVHAALKARGRRRGRGVNAFIWKRAIKDLGFDWIDVTDRIPGRTMRTAVRHLPRGRKFILKVRRHVAGFDGEKLVDWSEGRLQRIVSIVEIVTSTDKVLAPAVTQPIRTYVPVARTVANMYLNTVAIPKKILNHVLTELCDHDFIMIVPPARVNRERYIKQYFTDGNLPRGRMGVVELKGDAAVAYRKESGNRGKVFQVFGYKDDHEGG